MIWQLYYVRIKILSNSLKMTATIQNVYNVIFGEETISVIIESYFTGETFNKNLFLDIPKLNHNF